MHKNYSHLREMIEDWEVKYENNIAFKLKKDRQKQESILWWSNIFEI